MTYPNSEESIRSGSLNLEKFLTLDSSNMNLESDHNQINFAIADYQRTYDWKASLVRDFLEDIQNASDGQQAYFIGAVILSKREIKQKVLDLEVVDGQQRMVTITLLMAAIRHIIKEYDLKKDYHWDRKYHKLTDCLFKEGDMHSKGEESPRLILNPNSHKIYELILSDKEISRREHTHVDRRLIENYRAIQIILKEKYSLEDIGSNEVKQEKFSRFIDYLLYKVILVVMITDEEQLDAYEIFEVLNDRRQALTQVDLLKTCFFRIASKRGEEDFKIVKRNWEKLMNVFISDSVKDNAIKNKTKNETQLKHCIESYFMFRFGHFQSKNLYRHVRDEIRKEEKNGKIAIEVVKEYVHELSVPGGVADDYGQIKNNNIELKHKGHRQKVKQYIAFLNTFPTLYPILLVPLFKKQKWLDINIVRYYQLLYYVVLRIYAARSFPANRLQPFWANLANELYEGESDNFGFLKSCLINELSRDYPSLTNQESFIDGFSNLTIKEMKKARRILLAINYLYPQTGEKQIDMDNVDCEHILPQSTKLGEWKSFNENDRKLYLYRLGNYTLLGGGINKKLQNKSYREKKKNYKESQIEITKEIPEYYRKWDKNAIAARQRGMAELAEKKWRLDKV